MTSNCNCLFCWLYVSPTSQLSFFDSILIVQCNRRSIPPDLPHIIGKPQNLNKKAGQYNNLEKYYLWAKCIHLFDQFTRWLNKDQNLKRSGMPSRKTIPNKHPKVNETEIKHTCVYISGICTSSPPHTS